jgi:hypothetical protein
MTPSAADLAVRLAKAQDAAERAQNAADLLEAELLCAIGDDRGIEGTHAGKHYRAIWGSKTSGGGLDTKALRARGQAIRRAFQYQVESQGFAFVEVLSACPTNWGVEPLKANERVGSEMIPYFQLGTFKDRFKDEGRGTRDTGRGGKDEVMNDEVPRG